jgi:apyrase
VKEDGLHGQLFLHDFWKGAQAACGLTPDEIMAKYPTVRKENAPFFCMDLCYIVSLLEDGFGLSRDRSLKLSRKIEYNGIEVETSWALGASLIELTDSMH